MPPHPFRVQFVDFCNLHRESGADFGHLVGLQTLKEPIGHALLEMVDPLGLAARSKLKLHRCCGFGQAQMGAQNVYRRIGLTTGQIEGQGEHVCLTDPLEHVPVAELDVFDHLRGASEVRLPELSSLPAGSRAMSSMDIAMSRGSRNEVWR
jgi:hypothetical protein